MIPSQGRIVSAHGNYESVLQELPTGRIAGSIYSIPMKETPEFDEIVWRQVTRDLDDIGISSKTIAENTDYIVSLISKAFREGMFEELLSTSEDLGSLGSSSREVCSSDG